MWRANGHEFNVENFPSIRALLKGYRKVKPSSCRIKRPFSYYHLKKALKFLNYRTYAGTLAAAALTTGYFWGMRISEYMASNVASWSKIIRLEDLQFVKNEKGQLYSIAINFRKHKTNKTGEYNAVVAVDCSCPDPICGVHILWRFLQYRKRYFEEIPSDPVFLQKRNDKPMLQTHMRNLIFNLAMQMGLDPKDYSPHSLRSGRCSDLKRANKPDWAIKRWGRWRSDCWKKYYLKLDFSDIAKLSHLSFDQLGFQDSSLRVGQYRTDKNMESFPISRL